MSDTALEEAGGTFGEHLVENLFATWIERELTTRGTGLTRADIMRAVVELPPFGGPPLVRLNEEVSLEARAVASAPIQKGEDVTAENVKALESFWPTDVHPDSGWLAYAVVGDTAYVAFDLRHNKQRTAELLGLADDYLEVVEAVREIAPRPAVDNLLSAAELTVQTQMLAASQQTRAHDVRDKWLRQDEELGNAPAGFSDLLKKLRHERAAARYGDGELTISNAEIPVLIQQVRDMIDHAARRVGVERVDADSPARP